MVKYGKIWFFFGGSCGAPFISCRLIFFLIGIVFEVFAGFDEFGRGVETG